MTNASSVGLGSSFTLAPAFEHGTGFYLQITFRCIHFFVLTHICSVFGDFFVLFLQPPVTLKAPLANHIALNFAFKGFLTLYHFDCIGFWCVVFLLMEFIGKKCQKETVDVALCSIFCLWQSFGQCKNRVMCEWEKDYAREHFAPEFRLRDFSWRQFGGAGQALASLHSFWL